MSGRRPSLLMLEIGEESDGFDEDPHPTLALVAFTAKKKGSLFWGRSSLHFRYQPQRRLLRYWLKEQDIPSSEIAGMGSDSASNMMVSRIKKGRARGRSGSGSGMILRKLSNSNASPRRSRSASGAEIDGGVRLRGETYVLEAKAGVGKQRGSVMVTDEDGSVLTLRDIVIVRGSSDSSKTSAGHVSQELAAILNKEPAKLPTTTGKERDWLESVKAR